LIVFTVGLEDFVETFVVQRSVAALHKFLFDKMLREVVLQLVVLNL